MQKEMKLSFYAFINFTIKAIERGNIYIEIYIQLYHV